MVKRGFWTLTMPLLPDREAFAMEPAVNVPFMPLPLHKGPAPATEDDADDAPKPSERLFKNCNGKTALPGLIDGVPGT